MIKIYEVHMGQDSFLIEGKNEFSARLRAAALFKLIGIRAEPYELEIWECESEVSSHA